MQNPSLPTDYLKRMRAQLGNDFDAYLTAMSAHLVKALRINTLKIDTDTFLSIFPYKTHMAAPETLLLDEDVPSLGNHALHRVGLFYMQEPSAAQPVGLLEIKPGMRVLDLCAAPGGKAGQIAERLNGEGLLVANELIPDRARVLSGNLERLGVKNSVVTCMKANALCSELNGFFDAVLVDAPCSGEGMFRKEPKAVSDWSVKHVRSCARRQAGILDAAANALKPGGSLVYSTCTFSNEENEDTTSAFLDRSPDFAFIEDHRLYPHTTIGEGQYMALMKKAGDSTREKRRYVSIPPLPNEVKKLVEAYLLENMRAPTEGSPYLLPSGRLVLLPRDMPYNFRKLRIISSGVYAADIKERHIIPAHALAMAYPKSAFTRAHELSPEEACAFFRGEQFGFAGEGYHVVCVSGYNAGFGKASAGVMKSLLPKGLRGDIT